MGQSEVDHAIDRPAGDFEDSLQYHCSGGSGVSCIITRNTADFLTDAAQILKSTEFMTLDQAAGGE